MAIPYRNPHGQRRDIREAGQPVFEPANANAEERPMDQAIDAAPLPADSEALPDMSREVWSRAVWRCIDVRSEADLDAVIEKLAPLAKLDPLGGHERSPAWLASGSRDEEAGLIVFVLEAGQTLLGYAMVVTLPKSHWYLEAGSLTLSQISVDRFNCEGGVFLDPRLSEPGDDLVLGWLKPLRARCTNRTLVGMICVPAASPLIAATRSKALHSLGYRLMPYGKPGLRRIMDLPPTFDDYLKSLGRSTRQTLNRRYRKLAEEHDLKLEIASERGDVDRVFEAALQVSKTTYQWQQSIGLNEIDRVRRSMIVGAKTGSLRWYLLRCDGQPVAFMSGYLSGDRFVWPDLGFDPAWSDKAAGLVLQYLVIKDLIENMPAVRRYDCGTRDSENKRRFVKNVEQEHDIFLIPTTPFGTMLSGMAFGVDRAVAVAKRSLAGYRQAAVLVNRLTTRTGSQAAAADSSKTSRPHAKDSAAATPLGTVQVSIHDTVDALPKTALTLLEEESRLRFMNGLHWYRTFAATCLDEGQTPRFYLMTMKDDPATQAIMPMITPLGRDGSRIAGRQQGAQSLMSMTNHQSRYYGPITRADPDQLACLLQGFAAHLKEQGCTLVDVNHLDPAIVDAELFRRAFAAAGFSVDLYHDQTVVFDHQDGRSFDDYFNERSSKFRRNIRRQRRKLEELGSLNLEVVRGGDGLAKTIQDYQTVQKASWKQDEIYPDHTPALIEAAAEAGSLCLGILHLDDRPIAADLSFVSGGMSYGHKGHFDEEFRQFGVGDVMVAMMLEHMIDNDRVDIIDFGKHADPYKLKWLNQQGPLHGLVAFNPATLEGQRQRLVYRTRVHAEARLSGLKRRLEGSALGSAALQSAVKAMRGRSSKA